MALRREVGALVNWQAVAAVGRLERLAIVSVEVLCRFLAKAKEDTLLTRLVLGQVREGDV